LHFAFYLANLNSVRMSYWIKGYLLILTVIPYWKLEYQDSIRLWQRPWFKAHNIRYKIFHHVWFTKINSTCSTEKNTTIIKRNEEQKQMSLRRNGSSRESVELVVTCTYSLTQVTYRPWRPCTVPLITPEERGAAVRKLRRKTWTSCQHGRDSRVSPRGSEIDQTGSILGDDRSRMNNSEAGRMVIGQSAS